MSRKNNNKDTSYKGQQSVSISPLFWGPLMWGLMHEFAKYGKYNSDFNLKILDYNEFVKSLPYVLPCSVCRSHTKQAIQAGKISKSLSTVTKFSDWVWKLKTHANENTSDTNLSYDSYVDRLNIRSSFIAESDIWDLLFMMSYNYPNKSDSDVSRQEYYNNFLIAIGNITDSIPHLNKFKCLKNTYKWEYVENFQNWLIELYKNNNNGKIPDIKKYHK
jgi:hypothetical protein